MVNKPGWAPVTLTQTGKYSYKRRSTFGCYSSGPTFGGGKDLHVSDYASSNGNSNTVNLGWTYAAPSGHSHGSSFTATFLAGGINAFFQPDEVETFYETT